METEEARNWIQSAEYDLGRAREYLGHAEEVVRWLVQHLNLNT